MPSWGRRNGSVQAPGDQAQARTCVRWTASDGGGSIAVVRTIRTWRALRREGRGLSLWAVARGWS